MAGSPSTITKRGFTKSTVSSSGSSSAKAWLLPTSLRWKFFQVYTTTVGSLSRPELVSGNPNTRSRSRQTPAGRYQLHVHFRTTAHHTKQQQSHCFPAEIVAKGSSDRQSCTGRCACTAPTDARQKTIIILSASKEVYF
jgi:hypothetical protein